MGWEPRPKDASRRALSFGTKPCPVTWMHAQRTELPPGRSGGAFAHGRSWALPATLTGRAAHFLSSGDGKRPDAGATGDRVRLCRVAGAHTPRPLARRAVPCPPATFSSPNVFYCVILYIAD